MTCIKDLTRTQETWYFFGIAQKYTTNYLQLKSVLWMDALACGSLSVPLALHNCAADNTTYIITSQSVLSTSEFRLCNWSVMEGALRRHVTV